MATKRNKFSDFRPKGLGAVPAEPQLSQEEKKPPSAAQSAVPAPVETGPALSPAPAAAPEATAPAAAEETGTALTALLREKVPESLRVPIAAREQVRQLREKTRRSKDSVYLEALNLLFKKHGMTQIQV